MYRSWKGTLPLPPPWRTVRTPWKPGLLEVAWDADAVIVAGVRARPERGLWVKKDVCDLSIELYKAGVRVGLGGPGGQATVLGGRSAAVGSVPRVPGEGPALEESLRGRPVGSDVGRTWIPPLPPSSGSG
jgi:hypothetical protein